MDTYGPTAKRVSGHDRKLRRVPQIIDSLLAMTYDGTSFTNFGIMGDNACNMGFLPTLACSRTAARGRTSSGRRPSSCSAATTPRRHAGDAPSSSTRRRPAASSSWWIRASRARRRRPTVGAHPPRHRRGARLGHDELDCRQQQARRGLHQNLHQRRVLGGPRHQEACAPGRGLRRVGRGCGQGRARGGAARRREARLPLGAGERRGAEGGRGAADSGAYGILRGGGRWPDREREAGVPAAR